MDAASRSGTTLTTNSPVPPSARGLALRSESFSVPSGLLAGQKSRSMGSEPTPLKKEKGARLSLPSTERVETSAMGRGAMAPIMSL